MQSYQPFTSTPVETPDPPSATTASSHDSTTISIAAYSSATASPSSDTGTTTSSTCATTCGTATSPGSDAHPYHYLYFSFSVNGASLSKPLMDRKGSPRTIYLSIYLSIYLTIYLSMYLCMRTSFHKCSHTLIHRTVQFCRVCIP